VYTRQGDTWRALEDVLLPVPRGVRRVAIQTIVPLDAGGDADADGLLDLFIGVYGDMRSRGKDYNTVEAHDGGDNYLLMNRGGLQFEEVSERAGISGTQYTYVAEAFDFDGDGDTDLFEGNDFGPNVLWLNDGSGFFQADGDSVFAGVSAYTMGVTLADPDNTGAWHLYISNMSAAEGMRIAPLAQDLDQVMRQRLEIIASGNMLYAQDSASGRWSDVSASAGSSDAGWAWGCVFWDPDNDGDRDLIVTNGFTSHSRRDLDDWNSLYWRQVAADAGFLARGERTRDVNRDVAFEGSFSGYQRDRAFHNVDGVAGPAGAFVEAAWLMGLDADHDGRCVVPADLDGDGDQDLVLWTLKGLRFFENRSPPRSFARLRLLSASPVLGAVVSLTVGGVTSREVVRAVDGFQSQRPQELHFGLGDATAIDRVQVRWPSGEVQIWESLPVGKRLTLVRGEAAADVDVLPSWPAGIWEGRAPESLPPGLAAAATARAAFVRFGPVEPVWTSMPSEHPGVAWFCAAAGQRVEPQEGWAAVDEAVLSGSHLGGAPPHSALYDRDGNLRRTFAEQPAAGEVRALLAEMERRGPYPEVLVQAGRLALSDHRHREARNLFRRAVAADPASPFGHEGLARALSFLGLPEEAEAAYGAAVAADPDYAVGHHNLGVLMALRGRPAEAVLSLERALAIGGSPLPTLLALGEARAEAGDVGGALAAFERALAAHPQAAEAAMLAGKVLAGQDRRGEARARLVQALALDPDLSEARRALVALDRLDARDAAAETQTGDAQSDP
jgi:Flp pilus assembly protein TadD